MAEVVTLVDQDEVAVLIFDAVQKKIAASCRLLEKMANGQDVGVQFVPFVVALPHLDQWRRA